MSLGDFLHDTWQKVPGHSWLGGSRFGDIVSGGTGRAFERNDWRFPVGHDTTSFDDLAGAGASSSVGLRNLARGVGAAFGGGALYGALGGSSAAAGEGAGGASEVGYGFPLAEEAGGAGPGGQLSGPAASMGWQDYLRRYGRQGGSLLSNVMGSQGAQGIPMAAADNSMIAPVKTVDPFAEPNSPTISPEILAMLMMPHRWDQQGAQPNEQYVGSGGFA